MAVYNGEKFIKEQIESILNQNHPHFHLIIRDNASQDSTVSIVHEIQNKHPGRITLLRSPNNVGVIGNFAALMHHSQADYVMFSDADDVWHQDKVAKTFAKFKAMEGMHGKTTPLLVHTDLSVANRQLDVVHPSFWKFSHLNTSTGHALNRLLVQNVITGCTVMVNRSLLNLAMPIPENVIMHDWWLGLIASACGAIGTVDHSTMLYRQHGSNDTGAKRYGFVPYIRRVLNTKERQKISENVKKRFKQARHLLERHSNLLTRDQKLLLEAYIRLESASFFHKRYLTARHRFYKQGFLRNVMEFFPFIRF